MKFIRQVLLLCVAALALGGATSVLAAADPKPEAKDLFLKDDAKCTSCHDEADSPNLLYVGKTKHGTRADGRTPTCVNCHGDSDNHIKTAKAGGKDKPAAVDRSFAAKTQTSAQDRNDACLSCHKKDSKRSHWEGSTHQTRDVACASCHTVHAARDKVLSKATQFEVCFSCHKDRRAEVSRPSHHPVLEGKVACADCHNPHGSAGPKLMKRDSVNDTCYTCHMEKRGPFVHNHEPVGEDCTNCHNPHGTVLESMLKARPPFLCHQCHTPHGGVVPQIIGAQNTAPTAAALGKGTTNVVQGRGCMNCHTQVHGSNNPSATNPTPQFMLR